MSIIIKYPKQFSKEYKDFIIVLSKFSELKNFKNLPFDTESLSQSKEFEKTLQDSHYLELFIESNLSNSFHNIKVILIQNLKNNVYNVTTGKNLYLVAILENGEIVVDEEKLVNIKHKYRVEDIFLLKKKFC